MAGIRAHDKSKTKVRNKLKEVTRRNRGKKVEAIIQEVNEKVKGWVNYFGIADIKSFCRETYEWLRRRLRMYIWKQ